MMDEVGQIYPIHKADLGQSGWYMLHKYNEAEVLLVGDVTERLRFFSTEQKDEVHRRLIQVSECAGTVTEDNTLYIAQKAGGSVLVPPVY